jgi:glycosyltransferase involved in cell wall biosynthesis
MIHVAYFAPLLVTGGTQRHLQQVLGLLDPTRFRASVYTITPGGEVEDELRAAGVPLTSLALGRRLLGPRSAQSMLRAASLLRASGVHVVHGYQWRPSLVGAIVARIARVPLAFASKRSLTGDDARAKRAWRVIGRRVDTLVVNAEAIRAEAEAHGVATRWAVIPSGVDVARFRKSPAGPEAKASLGLDPARPVIGTVGRLEERKGHDDLLAATRGLLERANGLRPQLLLVGDGALRSRLVAQAAAFGIADSVCFAGRITDVRVPLAAMDVFVLPSNAEGMSNALLEAMAAARPVVATAVGGTREVLDGEERGVLVPARDPDALGRALLDLLHDRERARRLGESARRWVERELSADAMVRRLEQLYAERVAARAGGVTA